MAANWVVKLGGSFFDSDRLPLWLEALAETSTVIVPGGGPFADQVRAAEARWRFGDDAAHAMALLAMAQYGVMLAGLCPRLRTAPDLEGLAAIVAAGASAIWLPDAVHLSATEIPCSWDVTSDSLAAWLAARIGARRLLLVKSAAVPKYALAATQLADDGLVDRQFPAFTESAGFEVWISAPENHDRLAQGLLHPERLFTPVISSR